MGVSIQQKSLNISKFVIVFFSINDVTLGMFQHFFSKIKENVLIATSK